MCVQLKMNTRRSQEILPDAVKIQRHAKNGRTAKGYGGPIPKLNNRLSGKGELGEEQQNM